MALECLQYGPQKENMTRTHKAYFPIVQTSSPTKNWNCVNLIYMTYRTGLETKDI